MSDADPTTASPVGPGRPVLVACDFDGTLSPIVGRPADARPADGAVEVLERLADLADVRVAVVSGRPLAFLARLLPASLDLHGLYGLESRVAGVVDDTASLQAATAVGAAAAAARAGLPAEVEVEDKGGSLTLHWRMCPDHAVEVRRFADVVAAEGVLAARPAKASVELHPNDTGDKGVVVEALAEGCRGVVVLGDDVGDLAMFDAADRHATHRDTWARKVAVASAETPGALLERADLELTGPAEVVSWLEGLAEHLAAG